jgi:hypothetical protein
MTAREARYGIDPGFFDSGREFFRIEVRADTFYVLACMEIQMHLAKPQVYLAHCCLSSVCGRVTGDA